MLKNPDWISKRMKVDYPMKSIIVGFLITALLVTSLSVLSTVRAESGVGNDVFKVVVTLFDITNSTKDITTIVNVKDQTKVKVFNAENPERENGDTISYTMTFPDLQVDDGDPYSVCTVSVEDFELNCLEGNNSPLTRPEFVDINVSGDGNGNEGQEQDEDGNEEDDDQD